MNLETSFSFNLMYVYVDLDRTKVVHLSYGKVGTTSVWNILLLGALLLGFSVLCN